MTLKKLSKEKRINHMEKQKQGNACPYAKKCGGCIFSGKAYEEQLKIKQKNVTDLLGKFGKVAPILGAKCPEHYRNKVHGIFGRDRQGNVFTGIYEEKSHRIVPVENCMIEDEKATAILKTLSTMAKQFKLQVYDEDRETGLLRHALIRVGRTTGEIMVVLVLSGPILPSKNNFTKELCRRHPEITTVVLNINDKNTSMVLGNRNIVLYGKGYIEDVLCGLRFRISPSSFYQINSEQTERLYKKAMEFAGLTGKERVIDAYCGIGTIGACAAGKAREVIGVELNRDAVKDAITNAKLNQLKNIRFWNDDAGKFMVNMAANHEQADIVFMDPPRSGSTPEFINSVNTLKPKKVVYVSCDPVTLKRDLELFQQKGWKVKAIQPVDMFPYTGHVETVCLLTRKI
ncbi:MAG: 23S rRNA (uracil(1939)-C(5))-methyltransferase RlmD [Lachnospiraceae bacterium]|jgi:23S rRNA (uracil1939-C5)-methyltransferase|nr:23S rRNA (uracil(1939)-C(5))-methyltransferase RlmD [Lachnospiraceae bacterium]